MEVNRLMYSFRDPIAESTEEKPSIEDVLDSLRDLDSHMEELVRRNNNSRKITSNTVQTPSRPSLAQEN